MLVLTISGILFDSKLIVSISAIASAFLGSVISILFESIDTNGQGLRLWWQHLKYYNQEIRLSFSYLFKIEINGKYLLIRGKRLRKQFQPIGGVYKYYKEAKPILEKFKYKTDIKMGNTNDTDDLRISLKGKYILKFTKWFLSMKDREYDPYREFQEELINSGLISKEDFKILKYRKIDTHNKGITKSTFNKCNEFIYADIFELDLTEKQKQILLTAVENNPDILCLASDVELSSECYNGIEKNLGNNAKWLIGE